MTHCWRVKKYLTNYVLKTRLTASAKIRLQKSYDSNHLLVNSLKLNFLTKKSASALSVQLSNVRQGSKSIEEFGRKIEDLLLDLTLAQSEGNDAAVAVLTPITTILY